MDHCFKEVTEYDAAGSSRSRWEAITGNQGRTTEVIKIGNNTFTRRDIDKWAIKQVPSLEISKPTPPFESKDAVDPKSYSIWKEPGSTVEFKVRTTQHKGQDIIVYRRVINSIQIHPKDGSEIKKETINHYWIGDDGRLVKFEQWINHSGKHFIGIQKLFMEWELDPKIVVTAPDVLQ